MGAAALRLAPSRGQLGPDGARREPGRRGDREHGVGVHRLGRLDVELPGIQLLQQRLDHALVHRTRARRPDEVLEGVRSRDRQRFDAQLLGGIAAGRDLLLSNADEQAREAGVAPDPAARREADEPA